MSLTRKSFLPALGMAVLLAGTAAAGTIVVRSNGPSAKTYPPGKQLGDNGAVVLKTGDSVTILDGRGTRVLKGPGTFSTTASAGIASGSAIGQLLKNTGTRQSRTGAVRSIGTVRVVRSPNLWFVDATRSGKFCLADASSATIWRPSIGEAASVTLTNVTSGQSATLDFNQGQSTKSWPDTLPLALGADYKISGAGSSTPAIVQFLALGPNPQGIEGTASALIRNGCEGQLDLLVDTVAIPAKENAAGG